MKKYYILLVSIDNSDEGLVYTYNVYKRFLWLFWISVFSTSNTDKELAYEECEKFVLSVDGEAIDCDD